MSISTSSIGSYSLSSCSSGMSSIASPRKNKTVTNVTHQQDCRQDSQLVHQGWHDELSGRVIVSPETPDDYITIYVPSPSEPPQRNIRPDLFAGWTPQQGQEVLMYPFLVRNY